MFLGALASAVSTDFLYLSHKRGGIDWMGHLVWCFKGGALTWLADFSFSFLLLAHNDCVLDSSNIRKNLESQKTYGLLPASRFATGKIVIRRSFFHFLSLFQLLVQWISHLDFAGSSPFHEGRHAQNGGEVGLGYLLLFFFASQSSGFTAEGKDDLVTLPFLPHLLSRFPWI